jgi:hypothetical protein
MENALYRTNQSELDHKLQQVQKRLMAQQWLELSVFILGCAAIVSIFWLLLTRLFPVLGNPLPVFVALGIIAPVVSTAMLILRRPDRTEAAVQADARLGLKERFTSSLELQSARGPMIEALHRDARIHIDRLEPARDFPFEQPRRLLRLGVALAVLLLAYLVVPEFDLFNHREKVAERQAKERAIRVQAERLRSVARPLKAAAPQIASATQEKSAMEIERVAQMLEMQEISEKQAFAKLSKVGAQLAEQRKQLAGEQPKLKTAADTKKLSMTKDLADGIQKGDFGQAAQKMKALQKKLADGDLGEKEKQKLTEELKQL